MKITEVSPICLPPATSNGDVADADLSDKGSELEAEPEIGDEQEYGEIEEEVEIEEGVELEEEVEEIVEDLSDSPINENRNDVSQGLESVWHGEQLRSVSSTPEKSIANLQLTLAVEGSSTGNLKFSGPRKHSVATDNIGLRESAADKKDSWALPEKPTAKDHDNAHYDSKSHLCNSGNVSTETTKPLSVSGKEVASSISMRDGFGERNNGVMYYEEEIKQMGVRPENDMKQRASRCGDTGLIYS
ncbi:hypothetical protein F0562_014013 [Nyssa sinensis]|uniref:Uncharacterized protein n=1 Tax=Nyssa sinensis TaxID=561372 RepID=A0A5J4ZRH3_9ASTE|nr:hypothetical protein F0562_014013 [Nyssa sinensis]